MKKLSQDLGKVYQNFIDQFENKIDQLNRCKEEIGGKSANVETKIKDLIRRNLPIHEARKFTDYFLLINLREISDNSSTGVLNKLENNLYNKNYFNLSLWLRNQVKCIIQYFI